MHNHRNKGHPEIFFLKKKKKKKGAALAHGSVFETRLIHCQNISAISRKKVWQQRTWETALKFQNVSQELLYWFWLASVFNVLFPDAGSLKPSADLLSLLPHEAYLHPRRWR